MKCIKEKLKIVLTTMALIITCQLISEKGFCQKKKIQPTKEQMAQMLNAIPLKDDKILYDEVVLCDSTMSKDQLFTKIRQWFVENFTESKAVLEVNDIENGLLTGKGTYRYTNINGLNMHTGYTQFIINVAVKDGKFRYQLYDFTAEDRNQSMLSSNSTSYKVQINMNDMVKLFKSGKREKYARKFLEDMVELVYYIQQSLANLKDSKSIQDF